MLLSIIIIIIITVKRGAPDPPTATRLPGHEREKLAGSLHWRENKWGSRGLEVGQACSGNPHLRPSLWARSGFCRSVSTSSITWSSASPDRHRLLQAYWERQQNAVMFLFFLFPSLFCFLPAFFNIVYILCIIAFGASSFYSFLYQKCTTLLSSFELLECCLFQMGKLSKKKDTHCALFFIWSVYFLQDVEIARSFTTVMLLVVYEEAHCRRSVVTNMLLVDSGLLVQDVYCTVSSVHCMYTLYYSWIS